MGRGQSNLDDGQDDSKPTYNQNNPECAPFRLVPCISPQPPKALWPLPKIELLHHEQAEPQERKVSGNAVSSCLRSVLSRFRHGLSHSFPGRALISGLLVFFPHNVSSRGSASSLAPPGSSSLMLCPAQRECGRSMHPSDSIARTHCSAPETRTTCPNGIRAWRGRWSTWSLTMYSRFERQVTPIRSVTFFS